MDKIELNSGSILRDYEIHSVIGRGGFGVVYKAKHRELGIEVAIKEYFPSELCVRHNNTVQPSKPEFQTSYEESLNRFIKEARQLENFRDCSNIVNCRDLFRANGTAYIVMDYIRGLSLSSLLDQREAQGKPFTEEDLLQVILPLLMGLKIVHESGVCHRDIKPSNILIRRSDRTPILIDFGAAKHEMSRYTKSFAPYSDGYAALEQVGEGEIGTWTDMYGIGAVMWRMVAGGAPPFSPPNPISSQKGAFELMQGRKDPLPSATEIGEERFSKTILHTIDDCLVLNVNERMQNCGKIIKRFASMNGEVHNSLSNKLREGSNELTKSNQANPKVELDHTEGQVKFSVLNNHQSELVEIMGEEEKNTDGITIRKLIISLIWTILFIGGPVLLGENIDLGDDILEAKIGLYLGGLILGFLVFSLGIIESDLWCGNPINSIGYRQGKSIVFSPDGRYILSGSCDGILRLWNPTTGKVKKRFGYAESGTINLSVAFSPDGKSIISGTQGGYINIRNVTKGDLLHSFRAGEDGDLIRSVAIHPNGRYFACVLFFNNYFRLYKITGYLSKTFYGHESKVNSVAFSPDGKYIASGSSDATVRLWETFTGKEIKCFEGHDSIELSIAFSPDGKYIASGSWYDVRLWETFTGKEIKCFEGHESKVNSVAFSPDGKYIASGSADITVRLWETDTGQEIRCFEGHEGEVNSVAFSPCGRYIASTSDDDFIRLWYLEHV